MTQPCMWKIHKDEILMHVNDQHASNKQKRFQCYQHFVRLVYGPMGRGNRTKIPACCMEQVKIQFPEEDGSYTGYKSA